MKERHNLTLLLSTIILILAAVASAGGLLLPDLYRDSDFFKISWKANDIITLFVVVPLTIITIKFYKNGSQKSHLLLMGLIAYMLYNYAFYLFGTVFNKFFLLYVAIFALSIYALIFGLSGPDIKNIISGFSQNTPIRWIAAYLFFTTIPLLIVEGSQCVKFIISGKEPAVPPLIFALDLSIVIPNSLLAGFLLWNRKPWGYILSLVMLVKGFAYGLALCLGTIFLAYSKAYGKWDPLMPFYMVIALGGFIGCFLLFKNFHPQKTL